MLLKKILQRITRKLYPMPPIHKHYKKMEELLNSYNNIVDLGCGAYPHARAKTGVDKFIAPEHRTFGQGAFIDKEKLNKAGVRFVESDLDKMPFSDKEFDFAYCHHAIEHVDDPIATCKEIQRIAKSGVFCAPSTFAEIAFGRPYHKWFVSAKGNRLIFVEKSSEENQPFGEDSRLNPFDIALNDGFWSKKIIYLPRLRAQIREYWYGHHPIMETVFLWEEGFDVTVIQNDGSVRQFSPLQTTNKLI